MFRIRSRYLLIILLFGAVGIFPSLFDTSVAQADLPTRPPPRPPTPTPSTSTSQSDIIGAFIELVVVNAPANVWTVVQWQDGLGGWHDVEGWQGTLDDADSKLWWVAPKDLDTGPFRWQVLTAPGGVVVGLSDEFMLPAEERAKLVVTVTP